MELLTDKIELALRENGAINLAHRLKDGNTKDFKPVMKLFHPMSAATWLISEISQEGEDMDGNHDLIMFGLCDLGFGSPEMGDVSLNELKSVTVLGLGVERDRFFEADKTLTEYATMARKAGRIVA